MATSGSTDYASSNDILCTRALRIVGAIPQGGTPSTALLSEATIALNHLVKAWQADGLPLWALKEYALTMVASTRSYRFGEGQSVNTPYPLKIVSALRRHTSTTTDIPLKVITRDEYERISNKTITGLPLMLFYDKQRIYGDVYLYPVPDTTAASDYTIRLTYQRPFEDFDAGANEPDFPSEWFDALSFGLAERLMYEHGVPSTDKAAITQMSKKLKDEALSFGTEEGSIYFQIDRREWYGY